VAFLRGINLGKHRRVKSDALRAASEAAGMEDVTTFRASGNLVFTVPEKDSEEASVQRKLERSLGEGLGIEVAAFLRTARELREIAAHEPFEAAALERSKGKLQVALLPGKPGAAARRSALALAGDEDLLAVRGRELYWLPSGGMSESGLDLKALEGHVGPWTMRTMGTIEQIAAKHFS
jgi:uncharacterized protein (DUF1697 family)